MLECWRFNDQSMTGWCLGLQLEPLTLGHVFLLRQQDIDMFNLTEFSELLLAVFICSQPWRKAKKNLHSWWIPVFVAWWGWRVRKMALLAQLKCWETYARSNLTHPDFMLGEHGRECSAPLHFRLLGIATGILKVGWERAHDIPIRTLIATWTAVAEMRGEIELWGEKHEEFWSWAHEQDLAKQRKATNGPAETTVQA